MNTRRSTQLLLSFISICIINIASAQHAHANVWKSIFISGDDSIPNFDQGRLDLAELFSQIGVIAPVHHTSSMQIASGGSARLATLRNIAESFHQLDVKANEGCLIHMTSHGIQNGGFYLSQSSPLLPRTFARMVDAACGDQPTIVLISACYSGQFLINELKGDNRIIMTAAIADRPSFGCSTDTKYTYWDGCLLSEIPKSANWNEVYANVQACVQTKEALIGVSPSLPQAFFGANTSGWVILE
ncbi:MAG: C13 family peptidase [Bdellovibrionales bacterium]|jgi:hypothetical protein|nr:C13 family peptidase [Bdellovibrionales bacterium]